MRFFTLRPVVNGDSFPRILHLGRLFTTISANGNLKVSLKISLYNLHSLASKLAGRNESPSMGIIDSKSVKTSHHADPSCKGVDGNKKVKGRKEYIVVDTLGLHMAVAVHEANIHDKGAPKVIEKLAYKFPRLVKILADGGYQGSLGEWMTEKFGWIMEVVIRPDECPTKFAVLPKRWIVERSFS